MSYALILNPYLVIRRLHDQGTPGLREDKYNALIERAGEIGATDLDMPDPWVLPTVAADAQPQSAITEAPKAAAE
jgi:hypothetical protein